MARVGGLVGDDLRHLNPLLHSWGTWTPWGSSLASQLLAVVTVVAVAMVVKAV
jgi:hypothetical protein